MAREGYVIEHPNRDRTASKATRAVVVFLLLVSAGLVLVISIGGWARLEGARLPQLAFIVLFLVMAYYVARWNRGVLPVAAALAIILLIFASVAGPEWFERDQQGFSSPLLPETFIGLLTFLLIPLQVLLIAFAMRGFQQEWNVEVERPAEGRRDTQDRREPATA
jgi:cytochrome bd-type quinol oxidase subunit 2